MENEEFITTDDAILLMIQKDPNILKTDKYIQDRYEKIINILKESDDKNYYRLSNLELIKLLRNNPNEIKNVNIQKKILKIFQSNNIINIL